MDVSGSPHRGVLSADDMARWQPTIEAPLTYDYGRYTVCKPGVWSQGPVMLQQLALLKGFELDGLDPAGPEFIHLQIECAKLAFADREKFYGDPKFTDIPIATLLSDAYNDERRKLISRDKASLDFLPGSVEGFGSVVKLRRAEGHREAVGAMGAGEPTVGRFGEVRGDTVHFDIIDQAGNMISATPSGGWLQSSPVIPELGFCLGSRAQMFWLEEDHPAALAPGKRPRTTLSPTMALRDGEPYMAWGSPGGDQQDQWTTQFFLRHVHAKLNLQEAIDAPAWHSEHFPISFWPRTARPGVLVVENRVPKATVDTLKGRGHVVEIGPDWSEGRLTAASKVGRRRRAAANPKGHAGLRGRTIAQRRDKMTWSIIARDPLNRPDRHRRRDEVFRGRRTRAAYRPRHRRRRDAGAGQSLLRHRRREAAARRAQPARGGGHADRRRRRPREPATSCHGHQGPDRRAYRRRMRRLVRTHSGRRLLACRQHAGGRRRARRYRAGLYRQRRPALRAAADRGDEGRRSRRRRQARQAIRGAVDPGRGGMVRSRPARRRPYRSACRTRTAGASQPRALGAFPPVHADAQEPGRDHRPRDHRCYASKRRRRARHDRKPADRNREVCASSSMATTAAPRMRSTASISASPMARRWAWSANPAAARA